MEPAVQEKFEYLESVLGQFIVQTNTSLSRLENNIAALSMELREQDRIYKAETRENDKLFKAQTRERDEKFRQENRELDEKFRKEMDEFKNQVQADIAESRADRRAMNKEPDTISFLSKNNIFALGMKDENMDILNPDVCQYLLHPQPTGE